MLYFPIIVSAFSLLFVFFLVKQIQTRTKTSQAIKEGVTSFLKRQYRIPVIVAVLFFFILWLIFGFKSGVAFLIGAMASTAAGFVGMAVSSRDNLELSFKTGSVVGFSVVGLAILVVSVFYLLTNDLKTLIFLGLGGSLVSVFARSGGGIFVLLADLFETYVITLISAMMLAGILFSADSLLVFLPLLLGTIAILASIIASFFVRAGIMEAAYKGLAISVLLTTVGFYPLIRKIASLTSLSVSGNKIYLASLMGLVMLAGIFMITEYLASKKHKPVKMIASASQNGQASNIIVGLAISMQATVLPGLLICLGVLASFWLAGIYGVALAAAAMVSLAGMVISIHAFNNNAKSLANSYSIISASLASLILFFNFSQELMVSGARLDFSFDNPRVIAGLFLGGLIPYLFSFLIMARAGRTANSVVNSLKEMLAPGLILVLTPIAVGFVLGPLVLAGVLVGSILTGFFLAIFMTLGGTVWSNAKKYIEQGNYGGKDSSAYLAAAIGEAVAGPYKDTVGPGISILIKAMNIVALLIVGFLV